MFKFISIGDLRIRADQLISYHFIEAELKDHSGSIISKYVIEVFYMGRFAQVSFKSYEAAIDCFNSISWQLKDDLK
jgi:hypothetical protein